MVTNLILEKRNFHSDVLDYNLFEIIEIYSESVDSYTFARINNLSKILGSHQDPIKVGVKLILTDAF